MKNCFEVWNMQMWLWLSIMSISDKMYLSRPVFKTFKEVFQEFWTILCQVRCSKSIWSSCWTSIKKRSTSLFNFRVEIFSFSICSQILMGCNFCIQWWTTEFTACWALFFGVGRVIAVMIEFYIKILISFRGWIWWALSVQKDAMIKKC